MATTPTGLDVPAGTDPFDPDGDTRALAASLEGRIIVPVPNITARDALAAALSPTPVEPLYVDRANAAPGLALEVTRDGSTWETIAALRDTDWITATLQGNWQNFGGPNYRDAAYRRINGVVYVRGMIKGGTHVTPGTVLLNLPAGFRPAKFDVYPAWGAAAPAALELGPNGNLVVGDVNISAVRTSINVTFPVEA